MRSTLLAIIGLATSAFCTDVAAADETKQFVVIVDATAQMGALFGHQRKIDVLKASVPAAAKRLGSNASLTLWAFGAKPTRKCESISELVALKPGDKATTEMGTAMGSLEPKAGRAPAMGTLRAAVRSLGESAQKQTAIIMIAGTGDDCDGDICASARSFQALHPNAKLSIFGIAMSQPGSESYACAAKAMGGSFVAVKTGADLDRALSQILIAPQEALPAKLTNPEQKDNKGLRKGEEPAINSMTDGASKVPATDNRINEVANASTRQVNDRAGERPPSPSKTELATEISREAGSAEPAKKSDAAPVSPSDPAAKEPSPPDQVKQVPVPPPSQPEPNVILSTALTSGASPINTGVTWRISKMIPTPTGQERGFDTPVWTGGGGVAKMRLAEGRYMAEVGYGLATAQSEFTVTNAQVVKLVPLEAGMIAAEALQAQGSSTADGVLFTLFRSKPTSEREEVARSSTEPATFYVNAGEYTLIASTGIAKLETRIVVQPGKVSAVKMALNVGTLDIKAFAVEGAPKLISAWHRLYSATETGKRGSAPLLTVEGPSARVQMPQGSYRIESVYGQARQESMVTITAGQLTSQTVVLNTGEAKIHIGPEISKDRPICTIYQAGSDRKTIPPAARALGPDISFIAKAGLYDVECRNKGAPAVGKQAQIRVVAGETQLTNIAQ